VQVDIAGLSHPGKVRANNEDHFLVVRFGRFLESLSTNLPSEQVPARFVDDGYGMVVADGMGGRPAGEEASRLAITTLVNLVLATPDWILRADDPALADQIMQRASDRFEEVREALAEEAASDPALCGFGTTMTLAASAGRDLFITNIGDSRAYLWRQRKLHQLTHDHTCAAQMQEAGILTPAEAATSRLRHVLTRSLSTVPGAKPDVQHCFLENDDRLLLCSDGLNEMVNNEAIAATLGDAATSETLCSRLIDQALGAGGKDNVTVIVAQYRMVGEPGSSDLAVAEGPSVKA
jgi:protein phosphatase